jgi:hypothetical protein
MAESEPSGRATSFDEFRYGMRVNGFHLFERAVPEGICVRMRDDLFRQYERIRPYQEAVGMGKETAWAVHHPVGERDGIHDFSPATTSTNTRPTTSAASRTSWASAARRLIPRTPMDPSTNTGTDGTAMRGPTLASSAGRCSSFS